ncbi:MAG: replication initiator protein [Microvirus sp.]|nr:MAG: replication initiator protein [Microvirus sp.]
MACYYPVSAFKCKDGSVIFNRHRGDVVQDLHLPCGQCDGCRLERARQWAVRCVHEASLHEENCFITLTYNEEHVPEYDHLNYDDFQRFMKRLRKKFAPKLIRFFMCGEYGSKNDRPHYHACLFGHNFLDRLLFKDSPAGHKIFTSKTLSSLWSTRDGNSLGFATLGDVNFDSAGYVARYVMKKQNGRGNAIHYQQITDDGEVIHRPKEFNHMSLKPGIGANFYKKWTTDIYPHDHTVINGKATKPPRYYSRKLKEDNPELYEELQFNRHIEALEKAHDNTEERLKVKETVLRSKISFLKREL